MKHPKGIEWRPRPELNWSKRFCRPLRNHSATWPHSGRTHIRPSQDRQPRPDQRLRRRKSRFGLGFGASSGIALWTSRYRASIRSKLAFSVSAMSGRFSRRGKQHRRRLDGRQTVAARLAAQLARKRDGREGPRITRWHFSIQALRHHSALAWLQVPSSSTMPSMPLQDGALIVLHLALAVDGDDLSVGIEVGDLRRAEIEHRPARGIGDRPSQRLGQARPRQSDLQRPHF